MIFKNPSLKIDESIHVWRLVWVWFRLRISVLFACFYHVTSMQELHWIKYKYVLKNKSLWNSFILYEKQLIGF